MELQSKYGQLNLTPAKYLTELMCEKKAKKERRLLKEKFWREDYWKPFYSQQILAAHSLLKIYPVEAIIAALNNKTVSWVYSLRAPQLQPVIADEQNKIKMNQKLAEEKKVLDEKPKEELKEVKVEEVRKQVPKNSTVFNKLKDL